MGSLACWQELSIPTAVRSCSSLKPPPSLSAQVVHSAVPTHFHFPEKGKFSFQTILMGFHHSRPSTTQSSQQPLGLSLQRLCPLRHIVAGPGFYTGPQEISICTHPAATLAIDRVCAPWSSLSPNAAFFLRSLERNLT